MIFFVVVMFALILIRFFVLEIGIGQGFVPQFTNVIDNQLTLLDGDANLITNRIEIIMFSLKRMVELSMLALVVYVGFIQFKREGGTY